MTGLVRERDKYNLYTYTPYSGVKWRYVFDDRPVGEQEFRRYWALSFTSKSMRNICVSRITGDKQLFFLKDFMRVSGISGKHNIKVGTDPSLKLREYFGINEDVYDKAVEALAALREEHVNDQTCL